MMTSHAMVVGRKSNMDKIFVSKATGEICVYSDTCAHLVAWKAGNR